MGVNGTNYNSLWAISFFNTTIKGTGIDQKSIVKFFDDFITNFNAVLAKLDLDSGVTDTDYASTLALTDNVNNNAADQMKDDGMFFGSISTNFGTMRTKFNALLTKLDADGGVTDTDYSSLWAVAAHDANQQGPLGRHQGALYTRMLLFKTNFNAVLTKLDADV